MSSSILHFHLCIIFIVKRSDLSSTGTCAIKEPKLLLSLTFQVHAITYKCNRRASCNCGALIKIGNDVIRIDRCPKKMRSQRPPVKTYLYKNGDLTAGTKFETRGKNYIVCLFGHISLHLNPFYFIFAYCNIYCKS